ncbi:Fic family protein [Flagellimonas aequoris]|uniref:Fido domain-containing protein n=1 Tax=Flagellimonas aequoris TaxID=2306997 RepID=A0A418NBV5_9FLAO|nr:Fic family protein [Allomuricauda aequoris]RIV73971.1 hypothetical protein D2U88_02770 [Allomuricauda aequoris]TXK07660.1 hypothetical protein FQ019_02750 [Allomuricauda aequoris]
MGTIQETFRKYKALNLTMSFEEEREMLFRYVHLTNKLEGNKLTLAQTTQLLSTDTISGNNIRTKDILEQKGMYRALVRMLNAVGAKEELSTSLMIELNWLVIGNLWKLDDFYIDAKQKGQEPGNFKVGNNLIQISRGGKVIERMKPLSSPDNVSENMDRLVAQVEKSTASEIKKAAFLAQELWLHQPFVDGNKRTGRLLINFLTMKKGFPLFVFDDKSINYNSTLVEQYLENRPGLVERYIEDALLKRMNKAIDLKQDKGKDRGFRMVL